MKKIRINFTKSNFIAAFTAIVVFIVLVLAFGTIMSQDEQAVLDKRAFYQRSSKIQQILMNPDITDMEIRMVAEDFIVWRETGITRLDLSATAVPTND